MDSVISYIVNNYVWFLIGAVCFTMIIIGYIADKTDFWHKNKNKKNVSKENPTEIKKEEKNDSDILSTLSNKTLNDAINKKDDAITSTLPLKDETKNDNHISDNNDMLSQLGQNYGNNLNQGINSAYSKNMNSSSSIDELSVPFGKPLTMKNIVNKDDDIVKSNDIDLEDDIIPVKKEVKKEQDTDDIIPTTVSKAPVVEKYNDVIIPNAVKPIDLSKELYSSKIDKKRDKKLDDFLNMIDEDDEDEDNNKNNDIHVKKENKQDIVDSIYDDIIPQVQNKSAYDEVKPVYDDIVPVKTKSVYDDDNVIPSISDIEPLGGTKEFDYAEPVVPEVITEKLKSSNRESDLDDDIWKF